MCSLDFWEIACNKYPWVLLLLSNSESDLLTLAKIGHQNTSMLNEQLLREPRSPHHQLQQNNFVLSYVAEWY